MLFSVAALNLKPVDYSILVVFIVFMILVGISLKKGNTTSEHFLLAGRKIPMWITGIAFISANVSALELLGMSASAAEYGFLTFHFYFLGAIPGMIFLGIFMMPFYYNSKIRSVPEYLKLRYNKPTHLLNSTTTLLSLILGAGIYLYSMSLVFEVIMGWDRNFSIFFSAVVVLVYVYFGGLSSSIYTEVIQFFLTIFGLFPLVMIGIVNSGGWSGLLAQLPESHIHVWKLLPNGNNPLGWDLVSVVFGLGFVLSFSYWTCGFTEVQRAMAAKDYRSARLTPIIGAFFKIFLPFLILTPGLVALVQFPNELGTEYNKSILILLKNYYPNGILGLGATAILAAFMAGMSSSITALNTVFTYDLYHNYIKPSANDKELLSVGKICTGASILLAIFCSFIAMQFSNIMNYIQLLFSFFNSPLVALFLLGMFWKRATPYSAFFGLLLGTTAGIGHYLLVQTNVLVYKTVMVSNFYGAIASGFTTFLVMILLSFVTKPKPVSELYGLLYETRDQSLVFWDRTVIRYGVILLGVVVLVNIFLW